jgi:hypothetical protein
LLALQVVPGKKSCYFVQGQAAEHGLHLEQNLGAASHLESIP